MIFVQRETHLEKRLKVLGDLNSKNVPDWDIFEDSQNIYL